MLQFEKYLRSIGYRSYKQIEKNNEQYFIEIADKECSYLSSISEGRFSNSWTKCEKIIKLVNQKLPIPYELRKGCICVGLSQYRKPPTLLIHGRLGLIYDDDINRFSKSNTPQEAHEILFTNQAIQTIAIKKD